MPRTTPSIRSVLLSLLLSLLAAQTAESSSAEIRAAILNDFPPLYTRDGQDRPAGFAIDILRHIAERSGLRIEYQVYDNWAMALEAVRSGRADLIPGIGISAPRQAEFLFTKEIETIPVSCFVRASNHHIQGIESLPGQRVAVIVESVAESRLAQTPTIDLVPFQTIDAALFQLMVGDVDAFVFPEPVLKKKMRLMNLDHSHVKVVGKPLMELKRGYLLRKSDAALADRLDPIISAYTQSPQYLQHYQKWYGKPEPLISAQTIAWSMGLLLTAIATALLIWRYYSIKRLSSRIQASEAKFRDFSDLAADWFWETDAQHCFTFISGRVQEVVGLSPEQIVGQSSNALFSETGNSGLIDWQQSTWNARLHRAEFVWRRPDGTERFISLNSKPIEDERQRLVGYRGIGRDITERKQAELALIESEGKYRSMFQSAVVGMIVVIDEQATIMEWNTGAERAFGYTPEEAIGQPLTMLMPARYHQAHWAGLNRAVVQGELKHKGVTHSLTGIRKSGEEFPLELTLGSWKRDDRLYFSAIILDITERKRSEEKIRTLSQAIEQSPVSVIITDTRGNVEYANSTFERVTGYSLDEIRGKNPRVLKSGSTPDEVYRNLWREISNGHAWQGEFQNRRKNGEEFWEYAHIAPVMDDEGRINHYLAVKEDITLRKQQEDQILRQAHFDALTGLPNRFLSLDRLSQMIKEAGRYAGMIAILFIDLDDFKKINDTLGHETGDKLLTEAGERLNQTVRQGDTVGRLGGDEFIVLLSGLSQPIDASPVAENLLHRFKQAYRVDGRDLILTASIGIAVYPNDGETPSELLRNADSAMYHSKNQGRSTYSFFTETMNLEVARRLLLEEQMHGALERGEFSLCYQPQVHVATGQLIGVEALLRWNNPKLGAVSPVEFIPIAEHTGQIVAIGEFVLTHALEMSRQWMQQRGEPLKMAINLSPRQFRDPGLVDFIEKTIASSGLPSESLVLEITEGVLLGGHGYIENALENLNNLGVNIAMDDFGTGYSSLSYLRSYPFDIMKIDRSFVRDITDDPADRELVNAAIAMAHGLGLKVVAEGVETAEQLSVLSSQGCELAQGYLFGKPVAPEVISNLIDTV